MTNVTDKVQNGKDIAGSYDLTLLTDMMEASANADSTEAWQAAYAVGVQYEPAAGITGGAVSPWYGTAEEAFTWCADNEAFLKGLYGNEEPEPRKAKCYCCKRVVEVNDQTRRQFVIEPRPAAEMDSMYCGCRGWN